MISRKISLDVTVIKEGKKITHFSVAPLINYNNNYSNITTEEEEEETK